MVVVTATRYMYRGFHQGRVMTSSYAIPFSATTLTPITQSELTFDLEKLILNPDMNVPLYTSCHMTRQLLKKSKLIVLLVNHVTLTLDYLPTKPSSHASAEEEEWGWAT